jgi:RHS repeat-associated core domain
MVYDQSKALAYALHDEGMVLANGTYQYNLKDHLGNTRAMFSKNAGAGQTPALAQATDYYPFGKSFEDIVNSDRNRYLYNGKEIQNQSIGGTTFGWYDYGARFYDPEVPHFTTFDPMAEQQPWLSSYIYCSNNPINKIDPSGALDTWYVDDDYNVLFQTNDGNNDVVKVPDSEVEDFEKYADFYNKGTSSIYDSKDWNDFQKSEFGLADRQLTKGETVLLNKLNSSWSKECAVEYWLNPTERRALAFAISESLSQWTNPQLVVAGLSAGAAGFSATSATKTGENAFRYMTEGELKAIQETGLLRGGRAGETYWTKDLYKSASSAQNRLALPSSPTLRVEFKILNNPTLLRNGTKVLPTNGMVGKGAEFMTLGPVRVRLINWQPLK